MTGSMLVSRKLASTRVVLCASPTYLLKHGTPTHPSELASHRTVAYTYWSGRDEWEFTGPNGTVSVNVNACIHANNGDTCRLLDIQELLSDSGIGREMHVIVGQGQLDSVLHADPMGRRAFIEEAAGVLKHRKRKEKALRKLDAMQANLTRLTDLTGELRRQLKPLGKQAEIARKAQAVQADLRDARLRLHAFDLVSQRGDLAKEEADESAVRARRAEVEQALQQSQAEQNELEELLAADAPKLAAAADTWYRLSALEERLRGTVRLAIERARHLSTEVSAPQGGRDPEQLEAEAEHAAICEAELLAEVDEARYLLAEAAERRSVVALKQPAA